MAYRLSEHLKMVHHPVLNQLILLECRPTAGRVALDSLNGFLNVAKPFAVVPHSGTAS